MARTVQNRATEPRKPRPSIAFALVDLGAMAGGHRLRRDLETVRAFRKVLFECASPRRRSSAARLIGRDVLSRAHNILVIRCDSGNEACWPELPRELSILGARSR